MGVRTAATILLFLLVATTMECCGDAVVRNALGQRGIARLACFAAGGALLFGYGLTLNLAPIGFERVVGVYIATLFVVWQVVSWVAYRTVPTTPILAGGALIVAGGLLVAFWHAAERS